MIYNAALILVITYMFIAYNDESEAKGGGKAERPKRLQGDGIYIYFLNPRNTLELIDVI